MFRPWRTRLVRAFLTILLALLSYGCSNDGNENGTPISPHVQQVSNGTKDVANWTLDVLLGSHMGLNQSQIRVIPRLSRHSSPTRHDPISITLACGSGQLTFAGDVKVDDPNQDDNLAMQATMAFAHCDGINGNLPLSTEGAATPAQVALRTTLNGTVQAEGCEITFAPLAIATTANDAGLLTSAIMVKGDIRATCDGTDLVCHLTDLDLDDPHTFGNSCVEP